ncbi:cupin domain-containing protein [Neptunicoccus cionae]|uniref:cupin domain-containing protein n=1 Tax=Neptunicoccus cionae TaxID=2035344 RepID=UPI000C75C6EA|nr:cupin domain-containing protein [Amylibacter cionae]PLS21264.1 cupin [Amylibacter cionae]
MKNPQHVIGFDDALSTPKISVVDDPAVVDTPYESRSWRHFESPGKGAISGIWEAGPHKERCNCDYDEMCHILTGQVRLTDADGNSRTFGAGDSFVVAAGFNGTWENLSDVRKVFFILS